MALNSRQANAAKSGSSKIIAIVIGVVVVGAAAIAIGLSAGKKSDNPLSDGTAAAEYQPVTVSNPPLPQLGNGIDAAIGQEAPALQGATFSGSAISITPGADGNATMLVFLAHWCPHCNREVPRLVEWYNKGLVPKNLRVIGVTTASRSDQANWPPSEWIVNMKWPFEVMADSELGEAAAAYGVDGYPFIAIMNGSGKVVRRSSGELELDQLIAMVNSALATN
jgi:cytochrome c biogenesis protein CcmG/thiol:disulfide interchange protein DsbE